MARDLSARPHEILNLKIKDIVFKVVDKYQYAEVLVNGKTGTRHIPLIQSIPYIKDWLSNHPSRNNPLIIKPFNWEGICIDLSEVLWHYTKLP
jgi:integrase